MWQILVQVGSGRSACNVADIGSSGEWEGCTQCGRYWFHWGVGGVHIMWQILVLVDTLQQILVTVGSGRGAYSLADIDSSGKCGSYWFQWGVGGVHTIRQILVQVGSGRGTHNVAVIGSSGEWEGCTQCGRYWFH